MLDMRAYYDKNLYYVPSLEEVKADLYGYISDASKDAYGSRMRLDLSEYSLEELESLADRISRDVELSIEEDRRAEARARASFERSVAIALEAGAADRESAVRWLLDAEGLLDECSDGYANFVLGVGYDYNLFSGEVVRSVYSL